MSVKHVEFSVSIHGLEADREALDFLVGWIREATKAGLLGHQRDRFKFKDEFESDITVEIIKTAE